MAQCILSTVELSRLQHCETVIEEGLQTFVDVGNALLEIRDSRLYRSRYGTFEEYCQGQWKMSRSYAHRVMAAASTVSNLLPVGNKDILPTPASERQVRPLAKLPPDQQREAWAAATTVNPKPTAAQVEAAAKAVVRPIHSISAALDAHEAELQREEKAARGVAATNLGMVIRILEPSQVNSIEETATALICQVDVETLNFIAGRVSKERLLQCAKVLTQMAKFWET